MSALNNLESLLNSVKEIDVGKCESNNSGGKSIGNLYIEVSVLRNGVPRFKNHKRVALFAITETLEKDDDYFPKYLNLPKELTELNISLDGGFDKYLLCEHLAENGYKSYRKRKYEHFLKWIIENDYTKKIKAKDKPTFIGFSGNIAQLLITPFEKQQDWVIHVVRHNNIIFIDKVAAPSKDKFEDEQRLMKISNGEEPIDRPSYHAHKFLQLLTTDSKDSLNENLWRCFLNKKVNNIEKQFEISEVDFGDHSFLILHELKAIDPKDDSTVEFKLAKFTPNPRYVDFFRNYRVLHMWGRAVVAGANITVCGEREFREHDSGFLRKIKIFTIEDFESMEHKWSSEICYNFLDRSLYYILCNVPCNDSLQTYELTWKIGENEVSCRKFDGETLVASSFPWSL